MKITHTTIHPLSDTLCLISVGTDEGVTGWGSCFMAPNFARAAAENLQEFIIGKDPVLNEQLVEDLHGATFWTGRGGAITIFSSAIDIALWDLRGKV